MNIHECVSCADDVNTHGDVQIKRVGRLTPTDKRERDMRKKLRRVERY
jgi:hypothetical protein